jgi:hypothetical protein
MSHFTVLVVGNDPEKELEPFNENTRLPRYVEYTKEQLIEKQRKEIEEYKNSTYAKFLTDPEKYKAEHNNPHHIDYLENKFPAELKLTDEELHKIGLEDYEPENIGTDGEVYSTYNPKSKWDWYQLGGRWSGMIKLKEGKEGVIGSPGLGVHEVGIDQAKKGDIANFDEIKTFAVLKDGQWYEIGKMGWWAMVSDEKDKEAWDSEFKKLIEGLPDDTLISIYDCHI